MKLQADPPTGKARRRTPKIAPLIALTIVFTIIPLYHPSIWYYYSTKKLSAPDQDELLVPENTLSEKENIFLEPEPNTDVITHENDHHNDDEEEKRTFFDNDEEKHTFIDNRDSRRKDRGERKRARHREKAHHKTTRRAGRTKQHSAHGENENVLELPKNTNVVVDNNNNSRDNSDEECDLFTGEWVENPDGPYYTNRTCWAIQEHQNCMKFGRPDTGFMKWKWNPNGPCDLPVFDPSEFLEYMRGKSLAFVGDSVARNHMQSLICLLSRVTYPLDASTTRDENFKRWEYRDYNFNISIFWSPYLVRTQKTDDNDVTRPFNLFLDEFDESWTTQIEDFDYVILSAGQWFFRPTMFYVKRRLIGCLYCPQSNVTHRSSQFSYRRAFRTAFRAINSLKNYKGVTFLRTIAPSHFEGGPWDKGGDCVRTRPFKSNEVVLEDYFFEMYNIQLEELRIGERMGRRKGLKFRLFDMTQVMLLRPDGHPSKYGHWPHQKVTLANDCVHWCLPGPIDTWNDFFLELLRRENKVSRSVV